MGEQFHGFLVIDKPAGLTSRDAVDRALRWFPPRTRLGHTGTLDPLATGVLVLAVGQGTRLAEFVQQMPKTYQAGILLGATSDTDDAEGTVTPVSHCTAPDKATVEEALQGFVGELEQVPPAYSAAKVQGRRAYQLARKGKDVALQPRTVQVYGIDVLDYAFPNLELMIRCGKGTYIRSLARDLGEQLGCGGLIRSLRRTAVGPFKAEDGVDLEADGAEALSRLLPLAAAVADLRTVTLGADVLAKFCHGQAAHLPGEVASGLIGSQPVAVFDERSRLAGIGQFSPPHDQLKPTKILPSTD